MTSYICLRCGREVTSEDLKIMLDRVRCPYCDGRILIKARQPIARRVKAV